MEVKLLERKAMEGERKSENGQTFLEVRVSLAMAQGQDTLTEPKEKPSNKES